MVYLCDIRRVILPQKTQISVIFERFYFLFHYVQTIILRKILHNSKKVVFLWRFWW